ncbi:MAG: tetratricopeptide repeat protein [Acidobacteria bacterium]|nr:tetratricopeptide repeat protein [Acidobacteriota bacterium]MCI0718692.1 tetratricopeptide repeat protein [Acidobacteriota bacterium]
MLKRNQQEFLYSRPAHHHLFPRAFPISSLIVVAFFPVAGHPEPQTSSQTATQTVQQPSEVPAIMGLLETQLRNKQSVAAQQSVQKLTNLLSPRDPRFFQLASLCAIHEDYATAIPLMEQVRAAFPQSYDVSYNLSLAYFRNKNYAKAAETLQILLGHQPRAEAYNLLATVQEQRKRYLEAVRAFQKAAELEPGNEDYRYDYAFELLRHQTNQAAIAIFASGVRDFPKSLKLRLGLGCAYYVIGKQEDAARTLLEAITIEPRNKLVYLFLGKTYEQAGSFQAAITDALRAYLEQGPQDPWAHYHYGTILYLLAQSSPKPDFQAAKSYLSRAVRMNSRFAEAYLQLAIVLQTEGQNKESLPVLGRAVRCNPKLAAAHYRLGLAYRRLGEKDKAAAEFALSEKLNAENQTGQAKQTVIQFLVEPGK